MKWIIRISVFVLLLVPVGCGTPPPDDGVPNETWGAGDIPGHFPGRSGELRTVTLGGQDFTYEVIDGLAIYQSDMVLGPAEQIEEDLASLANMDLQPLGTVCDHEHIASGFGWFCGRWANGDVYYSINESWDTEADNTKMRNRIMAAIDHWEENTGLRFHPASGGVRIDFRNGDGCSSPVGRQENILGGSQAITISINCGLGAVIHEIGHAVGLFHEQSRNDRDDFVSINYGNIEDGKAHNFNRTGDIGNDQGSYDFSSVMHYDCQAFDVEPLFLPTLNILADGVTCADVGKDVLSDGDILAAYFMYPPDFSIAGVASSYPRNLSIEASVVAEREVAGRFLRWFVDGSEVATGSLATIRLNELETGPHSLEVRMIIDDVEVGRSEPRVFTLSNVNPAVSITAPDDGHTVCVNQPIEFRAQVFDADSPGMTLPDAGVEWAITGGAVLGTGAVLTGTISTPGSHSVTVKASDADGGVDSDSVSVQVDLCASLPPSAEITSPAADMRVTAEDFDDHGAYIELTLRGWASDPEDGDLVDEQLQWFTSNAEVQPGAPETGNQLLGTGAALTVRLSGGSCGAIHLITLVATDSTGLAARASRSIRIESLC